MMKVSTNEEQTQAAFPVRAPAERPAAVLTGERHAVLSQNRNYGEAV